MTETAESPQRVIDETFLRDIDTEYRRAQFTAETDARRIRAAAAVAEVSAGEAKMLGRVREYMTARAGLAVDDVMADLEAEVTRLGTTIPGLATALKEAEQEARDWEGYVRIKRRQYEELKARHEAQCAEEGRCPACGQVLPAGSFPVTQDSSETGERS